jgi:hypothetical protein
LKRVAAPRARARAEVRVADVHLLHRTCHNRATTRANPRGPLGRSATRGHPISPLSLSYVRQY